MHQRYKNRKYIDFVSSPKNGRFFGDSSEHSKLRQSQPFFILKMALLQILVEA
jgi:hypothetical protein